MKRVISRNHARLIVVAGSLLVGPGLFAGCRFGENISASAGRTTVRDSAGIAIVENTGSGWGEDEAWWLEPDLQVGELDGPLAFGRVSWVAPGLDGGLLLLDGQAHLVHSFDSEGRHVGSFGGEGDGPGEFRRPASATLVGRERVAVSQGFPPLLQWVDTQGKLERMVRIPGVRDEAGLRTAGSFAAWQVSAGGHVFAQVQVLDPGAEDGIMPVVLLEVSPDGAKADTVAAWTWEALFDNESGIHPYEAVRTWMPRADGTVVISAPEGYELQEIDPDAGLKRLIRRNVAPPPFRDEYRGKALEELRQGLQDGGAPASFAEDYVDRVVFEPTLPDILRVWVSEPDGRLWIGIHDVGRPFRTLGEGLNGLTNAWDVFEPDGRYLGRVPAPDGFTLRVVTEDALYGIWQDELEVAFGRRYRIRRPPK